MDYIDMQISKMSAALKKQNIRKTLFTVAAILVAFLTFYALVLPALTWERSLICDKSEHTHTDKCYEEVFVDEAKVLICENEEADHEHTDACYEIVPAHTDKNLICGIEEHVHDDSCYDAPPSEAESYTCGMVEHTHDENCYNSDGTLRCTIPEHEHTADCQPAVKKTTKMALKSAAAPLGASGSGTTQVVYWVPIYSLEDITTDDVYIITTKNSNEYALSSTSSTTSTKANMQEVSGKSGYYTTSLSEDYWWKVSTNGTGMSQGQVGVDTKLYNEKNSKYLYLRSSSYDILSSSSTSDYTNVKVYYYNYQGTSGWQIYKDSALYYSNGKFSCNSSLTYMNIYKQVIEEVPNTPTPETDTPTPDENLTYWMPVTSTSDLSTDDTYLVVTKSGEIALHGENQTTSVAANLQPVSGADGYFSSTIDDDAYYWKVTKNGTGSTNKLYSVDSNEYLRLYSSYSTDVLSSSSTSTGTDLTMSYSSSNGWSFYGRNRYLAYNSSDQFVASSSPTYMSIYKKVSAPTPTTPTPTATPTPTPTATPTPTPTTTPTVTPTPTPTAKVTYWEPITNVNDITDDGTYIIVSKSSSDVALYGENASTTQKADFTKVNGRDYYTTELGEEYWWNINGGASSGKLTNVDSGNKVNIGTSLSMDASSASANTFSYNNGSWLIQGSRYLTYSSNSFSTYRYSSNNNNMLIYKQVEPIVGPIPGTIVDTDDDGKPNYPAYTEVSGGKHDATSVDSVNGEYWSDPATSKLEEKFTGISADDGKVLTDKSVVYGKDDYGAISSYEPNTFGVTLSALAQDYKVAAEVEGPIDVVFVVDTSGSMLENYTVNGKTTNSATENAKALNKAMKMVMDANPDNRAGVVCFSNYSHKILELGRYTATNDKFFPESGYDSVTCTFAPSSSIQRTDGTLYKGSSNKWYGTYTQAGIAEGAQELIDATDKQVDVVVDIDAGDGRTIQKTVTMTRKPVIILLSDGAPTFCNENYSTVLQHDDAIHGNGSDGYIQDSDGKYRPENNWGNHKSGKDYTSQSSFDGAYPPDYSLRSTDYIRVNNPKGVMGYYTILSANSYKDQVAKAYGTDTYFYTIGLGMNPGSANTITRSLSSDIYKTAVLNPTAANIAALSTTSGQTTTTESNTAVRDISPYTLETSTMLQQLLNNTATPANNQWIKSSGGTNYAYVEQLDSNGANTCGSPNATTGTVPIINNPYVGNYQFNDGATFSNNPTADDLAAIYQSAIESAGKVDVYGFIFNEDPNAVMTISDTIGDGMKIQSEPVLNYGGENVYPSSHETKNGKTIYHYSGKYEAADGSGQTADLSKITAEVETVDGKQVVRLIVPDEQMPTYTPHIDDNGNVDFYYEALPVRLTYKVGLTEESEQAIKDLEGTGESLTFYTNEWSNTEYAESEFSPAVANPYYKDDDYDKSSLNKSDNVTDTKNEAWDYTDDSDDEHVNTVLGNNGKLEFKSEVATTSITINKVNDLSQLITSGEATFDLYKDEDLTDKVGTYTTQGGVLTITDLVIGKTYYLVETAAPAGFNKLKDAVQINVIGENQVEVQSMTDMASFADGILSVKNSSGYELPETGGIGTTLIYTFGGLLVAGALMYGDFLRRKRERRTE